MTLEQKNELELYSMTIKNRLSTLGKFDKYAEESKIEIAILDLESILIKTQYLVNKFKTGGLNHEK